MDMQSPDAPGAQGVFIDNRWRAGASGKTIPVAAPAEGRVFAHIAAGNATDIDLAVRAAREAVNGGAWGRLSATERGRLLSRLGQAVADHADELALIEARDTGKPMRQARADMVATARYFEAPLLPNKPRGVPRVDDRRVISGIVHVLRSGGRWKDAPAAYGPHKTLYNRFVRWAANGVWTDVFHALASVGGPPAEVLLDSTSMKAHGCAAGGKAGVARRRSASAGAA